MKLLFALGLTRSESKLITIDFIETMGNLFLSD